MKDKQPTNKRDWKRLKMERSNDFHKTMYEDDLP